MLRVSVTDRCNLRCIYCMPEGRIKLLKDEEILTFQEIAKFVEAAAELGINKIKLTGGEPLVRFGIVDLVKQLSMIKEVKEISLTTNGLLLEAYAHKLKHAGLQRINVSLDTLKDERFRMITRGRPPQPPVVIRRRKSGGWEAESFLVAQPGWEYPTHPKQSLSPAGRLRTARGSSLAAFTCLRSKPAFPGIKKVDRRRAKCTCGG